MINCRFAQSIKLVMIAASIHRPKQCKTKPRSLPALQTIESPSPKDKLDVYTEVEFAQIAVKFVIFYTVGIEYYIWYTFCVIKVG